MLHICYMFNYIIFKYFKKQFSVDNIKKSALYAYFYNFYKGYDAVTIDYILDIHKCLIKKHNIR